MRMFLDIPKVVSYHYREGNLNWPMIIYISLVHIVAAVGVAKIPNCSPETLLWAFILWPIRYVLCIVPFAHMAPLSSVSTNNRILVSSLLSLRTVALVSQWVYTDSGLIALMKLHFQFVFS